MPKILQKGNEILEQKAQEINSRDIQSVKIKKIIKIMKDTLEKQKDGIALASPQIGKSFRLFIVSSKAYELDEDKKNKENKYLVFINPEIIKLSKKKEWLEEGCLSVVGIIGKVKRSTNCTIKAFDENGKIFTRGAGGLLAQVFQHEIDHLNGILFTSKAKDLYKIEINNKL